MLTLNPFCSNLDFAAECGVKTPRKKQNKIITRSNPKSGYFFES